MTPAPAKFVPLTPAALAVQLARWMNQHGQSRLRFGIDGFAEVGTTELADRVAEELTALYHREVIRVSTQWWWRPASLRLEYGRQDLHSRLHGWVDVGSLRREVFDPLGPDGTGHHLTQLRDPLADRAIRQQYRTAGQNSVLIIDGPMLRTHELDFDDIVQVGVSQGKLARSLPGDRQWELDAFAEYRTLYSDGRSASGLGVVLSYEHPASPAVKGLDLR